MKMSRKQRLIITRVMAIVLIIIWIAVSFLVVIS